MFLLLIETEKCQKESIAKFCTRVSRIFNQSVGGLGIIRGKKVGESE